MTSKSSQRRNMYSAHHPFATAFNPVPARRGFGQPEPVQQPPRKVIWPPAVREYVQRCFGIENAIEGIERQHMEAKMKEILTNLAETNQLDSIDWTTYPTPQQFIVEERQSRANGNGNDANLSRKRKSSDLGDAVIPPWRKQKTLNDTDNHKTHGEKASKKQKKKFQDNLPGKGTSQFEADLERRRQRFGLENGSHELRSPKKFSTHNSSDYDGPDPNDGPVIGTCEKIEKNYFRLTAPPKPETVRPLPILEQALELVKKKWIQDSNYAYVCDQLKSIRQDLTVQHIKNEFTVKTYEFHARFALEKGDMGEYNQCQSQLVALYSQNLGGRPEEFLGYRILYFIYTANRTALNDTLADLTLADKELPAVKHALDVRSAVALGNYHKLFRLYHEAPHMGQYLMDLFLGRERLAALTKICKAYKPDLKIRFLAEELGFETDGHCVQFLYDYGAQGAFEEKEDGIRLVTGKIGLLFENAKAAAFKKVDIKGQI